MNLAAELQTCNAVMNRFVILAVLGFSYIQAHAQQAAVDRSLSATASTYVVPDAGNYIETVITADQRRVHFEGRYNYEELDTGSVWIGYTFSAGSKVVLQVTPMVGAVFGRTTGIAPGQRLTLHWRRLELYSEDEFVFTRDSADSFLYTWSEFTVNPWHWLRIGLVGQRTRAYKSERDIQRGFLVGWSYKRVGVTANVLNPDKQKALYIVSAHLEF
jgi:hypothetical protein